MKPWCEYDPCTYTGRHHHPLALVSAMRDPGPPPANLDGPPEPCIECDGTGRARMRCECPQCTFPHETDCDDCQGSGMVTPWTTAQWENYAEWIRDGGVLKPLELPEVSIKRGGIRWPSEIDASRALGEFPRS